MIIDSVFGDHDLRIHKMRDRNVTGLLLGKVRDLYADIDVAYGGAAEKYGFSCHGCKQNCCGERFFHFTEAEQAYLAEGLSTLGPQRRGELYQRAENVVGLMHRLDGEGTEAMVLCPLHSNGICVIYAYRPMICRLHGIPHEFNRPDGSIVKGSGCHKFEREAGDDSIPHLPFNRTGFYQRMASIEIELRRALDHRKRFRKTVAEMILDLATTDNMSE